MPKLYRDATTARHETPDVAELRRLAESATPGPWEAFGAVDGRRCERWLGVTTDMRATESARAGDVFAAQNCTRQDALFIAAANPAVVLGLLDRLAHMTEARDNARAEVERLTGRVELVREWIDHRGVDVSDRDGAYMDGYRAAQRHALQDAAKLRRALDEEPQP